MRKNNNLQNSYHDQKGVSVMFKALIVSDSHGLTKELEEIKNSHKVDFMIHCGDSELDMDADELEGFYKVAGNCDFDNRYPNEQLLELSGLNLLMLHGHFHQVKQNLNTLSKYTRNSNVSVICYGHSHVAKVTQIENQLFINPGSIYNPKGIKEKTYAIIEWDSPKEIQVKFYDLKGNHLEKLSYKASI